MRKTITTLLCIISILSFGQVKLHNENEGLLYQVMPEKFDTLYIDTTNDSGLFIKGKRVYYWNADSLKWLSLSYDNNPQDTIPVIMEVSDTNTTTYPRVYYTGNGSLQGIVYWIKGYKVDKNNYTALGTAYYPTEYLDENKKKLSRNIIVWQSK